MTLTFEVGSKVRCRNQVWEVIKIENNEDDSWTVRLYPENGGKIQSFLYPLTPIEIVRSAFDSLQEGWVDHINNYLLLTNATRLSLVYEYDKLLSISNSKMIPEPYQLLAVKKVMESLRQRFLIADDVGLGKTIEAGLIMQELAARHRGMRVLIIVPASLQDQWKKEMQRHFHRTFYIYNRRKMEGIRELVDESLNPWLAKNSIITSIDWIKPQFEGSGAAKRNNNKVYDQLMKVEKPWDLVIIDEAHYVATDSNRAELAKAVQEKCDSLLLTTATPHSGNAEHFFNLLNLIDPFMFSDPEDLNRPDARERIDKVMIRRGKETIFELDDKGELVKKFKDREPRAIEIDFSERETELYKLVSNYTAEGWATLNRKRKISASDRNIGKFLLTLVQKRMVSSLYALQETLKRRIDSIVETRTISKIGSLDSQEIKEIKRLLKDYGNSELMEDEDRELVERYIETQKIQAMYAERTNEIKTLRSFLETTQDIINSSKDSKLAWLVKFLQQLFAKDPTEKVIIFTEYRDTLDYLKSKLEKEWFLDSNTIVTIHGGMALGETDEEPKTKLYAERQFNDPKTRILLATDAASEGLNLQRYCHILINYELPWNPNRLEQRIGRIHRYGQRRVAQVYNLMIKGSKEAEIFKRLQDKIEIIRKHLGNMAEVLGILEKFSLDELILRVLDRSLDVSKVGEIAEQELKKMEAIAAELRKTQFLSGCRQFTRADIDQANDAITASQKAIPTHKDIQTFVEIFLHVYGDLASGEKDMRKLHPAQHKGVYRLLVPSVIQDDKLPKIYPRITFEREIATRDWSHAQEPEFLAFGHPLIERMVHYCRVINAAELGGKLSCIVADYSGLPGVVFNFLLRFEDKLGRVIREEIEPIFVNQESEVDANFGHKIYLSKGLPNIEANLSTLAMVKARIQSLRQAAESYIRSKYQEYYKRVETKRNQEIEILIKDLEHFDRGKKEFWKERLKELQPQDELFEEKIDPTLRGQITRIKNQIRTHEHRMQERRDEIEKMRLGAFPAPEILNMVIVTRA